MFSEEACNMCNFLWAMIVGKDLEDHREVWRGQVVRTGERKSVQQTMPSAEGGFPSGSQERTISLSKMNGAVGTADLCGSPQIYRQWSWTLILWHSGQSQQCRISWVIFSLQPLAGILIAFTWSFTEVVSPLWLHAQQGSYGLPVELTTSLVSAVAWLPLPCGFFVSKFHHLH